jgi:hypothetical protein
MKIKYLNYSQAQAICADYQHLVGKPFESDTTVPAAVKHVIIAPYSRILQWQFVRSLYRGMPYDEALGICRNGRYDVLVLPDTEYKPAQQSLYAKTLRDYLDDHGVPFNPGDYNCLRAI